MGRYDSEKNPFVKRLAEWSYTRINDRFEREAKSIPCHVVKVEKDFVHVAFETQNGVFTPPVVKLPQAFSGFGREPTQVKDKGYAVPGQYYMGGVSDYAGGRTNFYPRGNLTSLSFHPVSKIDAPKRDYDQHTETGGPSGWTVKVMDKQQDQQQQQQQSGDLGTVSPPLTGVLRLSTRKPILVHADKTAIRLRGTPSVVAPRMDLPITGLGDQLGGLIGGQGTTGQDQQSQQDDDKTNFGFDKDGKAVMQSKDVDHIITVDSKNKVVTVKVPIDHTVFLGGDGQTGKYDFVTTKSGISKNTKARIG
jgi:hypothetical protein